MWDHKNRIFSLPTDAPHLGLMRGKELSTVPRKHDFSWYCVGCFFSYPTDIPLFGCLCGTAHCFVPRQAPISAVHVGKRKNELLTFPQEGRIFAIYVGFLQRNRRGMAKITTFSAFVCALFTNLIFSFTDR